MGVRIVRLCVDRSWICQCAGELSEDPPDLPHAGGDGRGYPNGLKEEEIPISARIFTLVDHWDALLSDRPYRKAWEKARMVEYIRERSGSVFDPALVDVFLEVVGA